MHTQRVRNWGYFDKVLRIVRDLYTPLNSRFREHIGIEATQLVSVFHALVKGTEQAINARWKRFRLVFSDHSISGMIKRYYSVNSQFVGSPEEMIAFATENRLSPDQVAALILSHSDLSLADLFTFKVAAIATAVGIREEDVVKVMERLSLRFGDLRSSPPESLFLDNPVWRKPMIQLGDGSFFCAMPQVFFSFIFQIFDDLTAGEEGLKRACQDRRAKFLEKETAKLFAGAFPGCEMVTGFRWRDGDKEFESDLLVRVDSYLILVETKSGAVSWPALRGAPERTKRHIEELLYAPSVQSNRFAEYLRAAIREGGEPAHVSRLGIALDQVRTILRLSVTLEDFAVVQANLHTLKGTGWLPDSHVWAPCILLADLEVIFEMLEPMGQKLHYLRRRAELEEHLDYHGDELDLLGLYLMTGFNLGEVEFGDGHYELAAMSSEIDDYFTARAEGVTARRPRLRLTKWWSDICYALEQRRFHQWSEVTNILLGLSLWEQRQAEIRFKRTKRNVRKNWRDPNHVCSVVVVPHAHKSDAIALYAFTEQKRDERRERMGNISSRVFAHPHVRRCLVIGCNVDRETYPYETLALFCHGEAKRRNEDFVIY